MLVVVTGCMGFVGRHLTRRLAASDVEMLGVSRSGSNGPYLGHASDMSSPESLLPGRFADREFTLVHLAWHMDRGCWAAQAGEVARLAGILEYWWDKGLARLIVAGSAAEYGSKGGVIEESDGGRSPFSPYGWAKQAACRLTSEWWRRTTIPTVWLRPFVVFGPGQTGQMALPYAVAQARKRQKATFTAGTQRRDFVYVDDVVDALLKAITAKTTGFLPVNVGSGCGVAVRSVIEELADRADACSLFEFGARPQRDDEPDEQTADIRAATQVLGWSPQVRWQDGIARLWEHEKG